MWALFAAEALATALCAHRRPAMRRAHAATSSREEQIAVGLGRARRLLQLRQRRRARRSAGILIAAIGLTATYAIDVVTFAASLVAILLLPAGCRRAPDAERASARTIVEGFRFVRRKPR